MAAELKFQHVW